ncbi:hypothetical protein [Albidovulum sediminis]|uniref:Uncharacterized protein n=1 Tax=Albidovulum sediminis TaxID=3066345 RepID=A0ABT2NPA2_9RHOB|nr:hypothetical protein [Defluviimonas sediminis]MCT8330768.1 hypothetical protein [Defluviimonas sediminis]
MKGSNLLVLRTLAEAADAGGILRASRQSMRDRARVNRSAKDQTLSRTNF